MSGFAGRVRALVHELRRRRVFRVAALYAATAFVVVQVAQAIVPPLQLPSWSYTLVVVLALLGFPLALVLAWAVDITPEGIRRTSSEATSLAPTAVSVALAAGPELGPLPAPPAAEHSIAVLPFADLSPAHDSEYFSDGLTDEIIAALAKVRPLRVTSRTSVMGFKRTARDLPAIARELGVRYVLEGSVRKAGESLRVTAQLIEAEHDAHLWADSYTGTLEDVFGIQERLAVAIGRALQVQLLPPESTEGDRSVDPRVREAYLRAWHEIWSWTGGPGLERARQIAQNAIDAFGEHELLLAAIGTTYWQQVNAGTCRVADFPEHLRIARAYAERAVALNPRSSAARVLLGEVHNNTARPLEAALEFHRAARLDPSNADALMWLAFELGCGGLADAAQRTGGAALAIDPLRGVSEWCNMVVHLMVGRFPEAVAHARRTNVIETAAMWVEGLGFTLAHAGEMDEAARVLEPVLGRERWSLYDRCMGFALNAFLGRREAALPHLTSEVLAGARWDDFEALFLADGYAALGEAEAAFRWWNRAVELGVCAPDFLARHDRFLAPLRGEPEFARLLERARAASDSLRAALQREPPLDLLA